jgi:hypothetical protein
MSVPFDLATGFDSGGFAFPKPCLNRCFNYKLPNNLSNFTLAVHVTYWHSEKRFKYVNELIKSLNSLSCKTQVFVHTNNLKLKLHYPALVVFHDMTGQDGHTLSWKHRPIMASTYINYDAVMYIEDDILFNQNNLEYWYSNHSLCSRHGYNLGFLRIEYDRDKAYCTDISPKFSKCQPLPKEVNLDNELFYLNDNNFYSGLWILDQEEFEWFSAQAYFDLNICPYYFGYKREAAAVGAIPMFKGTLLKDDIKGQTVHHMPNNYINYKDYCKISPEELYRKQ